jgi:hypothetical protein
MLKNIYHGGFENWQDVVLTPRLKEKAEGVSAYEVCLTIYKEPPSEVMKRYMAEQLAVGALEGKCHITVYGEITNITHHHGSHDYLMFTFEAGPENWGTGEPQEPMTMQFAEHDITEMENYYIHIYKEPVQEVVHG